MQGCCSEAPAPAACVHTVPGCPPSLPPLPAAPACRAPHPRRGASTNPAKVLKRLRKARLAATRGVVQGQKKRARPLAGANQFHKRKSKKK